MRTTVCIVTVWLCLPLPLPLPLSHSLKGFFNEWADISMCSPPPLPVLCCLAWCRVKRVACFAFNFATASNKNPKRNVLNSTQRSRHRCLSLLESQSESQLLLLPWQRRTSASTLLPSLPSHTHYASAAPSPSTAACSFNMSCGYGERGGQTAR